MIPFKDDVPTQLKPVVTIALIVINCLVFLFQNSLPQVSQVAMVQTFGVVPQHIFELGHWQMAGLGFNPLYTVFTSMFMHGGWFHLGGNMLYLWIFGNNVEDSMGHLRFIVFYLVIHRVLPSSSSSRWIQVWAILTISPMPR